MLNNLSIFKNLQKKNLYNKVSHIFKVKLSISSVPGTGSENSLKKSFDSKHKSKRKNRSLLIYDCYLINRFKLIFLAYLMEFEVILKENYPLATQTFGLNKNISVERYVDKLERDLKDCIKLNLAQKKLDKWSRHMGYYQVYITYGKANASKISEPFIDSDSSIDFNGFEENIMKWCMESKYRICELPAVLSTEDMVDLLLRLKTENKGTFLPFYHKSILTTNKKIKFITYCGEELFFNPIKTNDKKLFQLSKCIQVMDNKYSCKETSEIGIGYYALEISACLTRRELRDRIKSLSEK